MGKSRVVSCSGAIDRNWVKERRVVAEMLSATPTRARSGIGWGACREIAEPGAAEEGVWACSLPTVSSPKKVANMTLETVTIVPNRTKVQMGPGANVCPYDDEPPVRPELV